MSARPFTVFQDAPAPAPAHNAPRKPATMLTRSAARRLTDADPNFEPLDKENLNPVTGQRVAGASGSGAVKKRKTSVLATKVQPEPTSSKSSKTKASDSATEPEKKKRKASTSSTASSSKPKAKSKSTTGASKKSSGMKPTKRASSKQVEPALPRVPEEDEQAQIDSRCYDLTVKPLADVSEAYYDYDDAPAFEDARFDPDAKFATVKAASVEPEIRDYIEDPRAILMSNKPLPNTKPLSLEDLPEAPAFSTPERKKIYAAFTFSSPPSVSKLSFSKDSRAPSRSTSVHSLADPLAP